MEQGKDDFYSAAWISAYHGICDYAKVTNDPHAHFCKEKKICKEENQIILSLGWISQMDFYK